MKIKEVMFLLKRHDFKDDFKDVFGEASQLQG
jgi:hypothetical protein